MLKISVPENKRLVWYLALEEYVAARVKEDTIFFWIVSPTVIFGRHQVMLNEVNTAFCEAHKIAMYRRKSGGGCVYADRGNLMISYITNNTHSEAVFQHYLDLLTNALSQAGYPAVTSEHNDVLVNGRKVSGNACYALPTGTIVHGTLLWNVDFGVLQQAITPTREKLQKHGVESVRQRVVNLSSMPSLQAIRTVEDMRDYLASCFATETVSLTDEEIRAIDAIEAEYLDPDFIAGC